MFAEKAVVDHFARLGGRLLAERWRGKSGEIDLVFQMEEMIFVEVKASATHERALAALHTRQIKRLVNAGEEFLEAHFGSSLVAARFDVALVNQEMQIRIVENALL